MEGEDYRLVGREQCIEILIRQPMRVLARRLQLHQVDNVYHPHFQIGRVLSQQVDGSKRFQRRNIAATGHHDIGFATLVIARPVPDPKSGLAVLDRLFHRQPLGGWLLPSDDKVDVIPATQTVIGVRQQTVGVGRQVDPHDFRLLVDDMIDETGILMAEAIVILPPDMARKKIVQ